jgi:hypothetical protein
MLHETRQEKGSNAPALCRTHGLNCCHSRLKPASRLLDTFDTFRETLPTQAADLLAADAQSFGDDRGREDRRGPGPSA